MLKNILTKPVIYNNFKRNMSVLSIYRNTKGKTRMEKFQIDNKNCGPMVLDALIDIKNKQRFAWEK